MDEINERDNNRVTVLSGITDDANQEIRMFRVDPATGRLLVSTSGGVSGDVTGPGSSTNNAIARFDGTTGKIIQNSVVTIADTTGNIAGVGTLNTHTIPGGTSTFAIFTDKLSVFAATTSAELSGVLSDETGTGLVVFNDSPVLLTPDLGTPSAIVGTNMTGTGASFTAGTVSTITGLAPDTATTQATQPNITSLGTLTILNVDDITINGNAITSAGASSLTITALAGQAVSIEGVAFDGGVVTGASSITSTSFVGALTGNADTVTTNANLTGEVTSSGNAATLDVTAISNQSLVSAVATDMLLIEDATDGTLKRVDAADFLGAAGTVTDVSVVTANGLAGTVATSTTTPAITISTTITGILEGNGTAISAASTTGTGNVVLSTSPVLVTPNIGTPSTAVLTNATGLPAASVLAGSFGTGAYVMDSSLQVVTIELGAATDTTLARVSAGIVSIEGNNIITANIVASVTVAGVVELATTAEIDTGTDSTRAMPVDQFVASNRNIRWLVFNVVDRLVDCSVLTNVGGDFVSPIAGTILQSDTAPFFLYATNSTAGVTGTMVVDISLGGTSIMTTNKLDFDTTEKTTTTAATPPDLTDTTIAVGDILTIDIDSIHTTAAKGLTVYMAIREN